MKDTEQSSTENKPLISVVPDTKYRRRTATKSRKIIGLTVVLLLQTQLSSCQVNWFGSHFTVSWWAIAIPVTIFSVIMILAAHIHLIRQTFRCPQCGTEFQPKWHSLSVWLHMGDDRVVKCPHCGRKGFCKNIKDGTP